LHSKTEALKYFGMAVSSIPYVLFAGTMPDSTGDRKALQCGEVLISSLEIYNTTMK